MREVGLVAMLWVLWQNWCSLRREEVRSAGLVEVLLALLCCTVELVEWCLLGAFCLGVEGAGSRG